MPAPFACTPSMFDSWEVKVLAVWRREEFGEHRATHAAFKTAKQTFTDHADRSGKDGAAKQLGAGHAMTRRSRKAMSIAQHWRWRESWWPISWQSTVVSAIFK